MLPLNLTRANCCTKLLRCQLRSPVFLYQEVKSILIHELPPAKPRTANGFAPKAYMVGRCIGSLAAVVFLICDGNVPGRNITIYEAMPVLGGSLDGDGNPTNDYTVSRNF